MYTKTAQQKMEQLTAYLKELGEVAVAFSGGVDSTFLLKAAHDALGDRAAAVTVHSVFFPEQEMEGAGAFCRQQKIRSLVCGVDVLAVDGIADNPKDRCYRCKRRMFEAILQTAEREQIAHVVEGTNVDDEGEYRPGMRAIAELQVKSPLREIGMTKADIRELSKELGLDTWQKPSLACLASRFAYGEPITKERLSMVDRAERLLFGLGFPQVRVRIHGVTARIELLPEDLAKIIQDDIRDTVVRELTAYGFLYVTLDLKGYRTGSMDEAI